MNKEIEKIHEISAVAEVVPQTLDEYICSSSLEERAKWFIKRYDYFGDVFYLSTLTEEVYDDYQYDEALQATIEALKQPKE